MSSDRFKQVTDFLRLKPENVPPNIKLAIAWELAREKEKLELEKAKPEGPKSLSEREAAAKLKVGERTIRNYVKRGKLRRLKKNGRIACDAKWKKMCTE